MILVERESGQSSLHRDCGSIAQLELAWKGQSTMHFKSIVVALLEV
jgi:hypothetical protein